MAFELPHKFAPFCVYAGGSLITSVGLYSLVAPVAEVTRFGLPREDNLPGKKNEGRLQGVSPFIYIKGFRDIVFGANFMAMQYQGNVAGVNTAALALAALAFTDAFVIWTHSIPGSKNMTFGHGTTGIILSAWVAARTGWW